MALWCLREEIARLHSVWKNSKRSLLIFHLFRVATVTRLGVAGEGDKSSAVDCNLRAMDSNDVWAWH